MQQDVIDAEMALLGLLAKTCASFCDGNKTAEMTLVASRYQMKFQGQLARRNAKVEKHQSRALKNGTHLSRRQR